MPIVLDDSGGDPLSPLNTALRYAARGWKVFPLHEILPDCRCSCRATKGAKRCEDTKPGDFGKHPRTKNGLSDASTSEAKIRSWWKTWLTANIGILTGTDSGIWMLGPDGPRGIADLEALVAKHGPLSPTAVAKSGSGGRHYYFQWPADGPPLTNRANHRGTKIDVRGQGGYIVAPPSRNGNGPYEWVEEVEPAPAPDWLLEWVRGKDKKATPLPPTGTRGSGQRADAHDRASAYLAKMPPAISGQGGHNLTFAAARAVVWGFDLGADAGYDLIAAEFNPRCNPPWTEGELRHKCEDADTKPFDKPRGYLLNAGPELPAGECPSPAGNPEPPRPHPMSPEPTERPWPEPLSEDAYIGPLADYVRAIAPNTEADPAAVLVQCLIFFGSVVGRRPFVAVGNSTHHLNEFAVIVGDTSAGRKGTSHDDAKALFSEVDDCWFKTRLAKGLSSGEGLIHFVRDPVEERQPVKEKGRVVRYESVVTDHGEEDKRALITEPEFVNVLKQSNRETNILSVVLRQAWESGTLRTLTKVSPTRATGAHISVIGHITETELKKHLSEVETANGFGNRFLWFVSKRSKFIPEPRRPDPAVTAPLQQAVCLAVGSGLGVGEIERDEQARELWRQVYERFDDEPGGLCGAMTARGAPHVIRLSCIYALTECSPLVTVRHLKAALAVWNYSVRSVRYLFGESTGDTVADDALRLLRQSPKGVSRTDICNYFGRNLSAARLKVALNGLLKARLARVEMNTDTGGRPAEVWFATAPK
jgi:hypothetical protein